MNIYIYGFFFMLLLYGYYVLLYFAHFLFYPAFIESSLSFFLVPWFRYQYLNNRHINELLNICEADR